MSRACDAPAVDAVLPVSQLLLFGLQHVLVMAAVPITSVFLVAKALGLEPALTVNLISATFLLCGVGTLLQSFGPWKFGARLPFVMVPGGAPIVMFVTIAQQRDLQTASGAVILTALFYFLVLPVFARCLRYFPKIVIGTLLLLVSITSAWRSRPSASPCCSRACSRARSASSRCCWGCWPARCWRPCAG